MIKTHKPRGHIWTHASAFQQTKEYRDINFDECTVPKSKILVKDPDEALSEAAGAAKRRRIEKLADDFLNGVPLFISSARPCPQSLKSTIVWNKKSSNEPKFVLPNVDLSDESSAESQVWEEVESDVEILERWKRHGQLSLRENRCEAKNNDEIGAPIEEFEAEQAQANCGRVPQLKSLKITSGPSEDALRKAAGLRARRLQRANSEVNMIRDNLSLQARAAQTEAEPRSEPSYDAPVQSYNQRHISNWLSRRKSLFSFIGQQERDESIDELQLSRNDTPSRQRKSEPETEPIPAGLSGENDSCISGTRHSQSKELSDRDQRSLQKASYHTAPEQTEAELDLPAAQIHNDASVSTSTSCGTLPGLSRRNAHSLGKGDGKHYVEDNTPQQPSTSRVTRSTTSRQAPNTADPILPPKQDRRTRPIRSEPKSSSYRNAQSSQYGSTPLVYRKGRLHSRQASAEQDPVSLQQTTKGYEVGSGQTPSNIETTPEFPMENESAQTITAAPPMLDMSFEHNSSFAPNLNMALVDEHLNSILPTNPESERRSSAIKKAIRLELRNSGAEISRCASEPLPSSQVERPAEPESPSQVEPEPVESMQEEWAGTQFLLKQAQRDLLTSPEKQETKNASVDQVTPQTNPVAVGKESASREPLEQLSQEALPSTQQLLGNFEGWSTVKKPRAVYRNTPVPTPTGTAKNGWTPINSTREPMSTSDLNIAGDEGERRRSSLRFSIASVVSPEDVTFQANSPRMRSSTSKESPTNLITSVPSLVSSNRPQISTRHSSDIPVPRIQRTEDDRTLESFTSEPPLSSNQAAQSGFHLLRDPSNLSETIEDLTREVLLTGDLDGVLSQVS